MNETGFSKGVHKLGNDSYAYLQPDGSWGLSNAGLVVDGNEGLLVDTLFDLRLTREMLDAYGAAAGRGVRCKYLVCTHGNGDHTYGNQLVSGAEIVGSRGCGEDMSRSSPRLMSDLLGAAPQMGDVGKYILHCFGAFDFSGIDLATPTLFVDGERELRIGQKTLRVVEVGPAHTAGDVVVHAPDAGVVYAGDMLFVGGMPIMWVGPMANWTSALDLIMGMDADVVVPGHGPLTDQKGVARCRDILLNIQEETKKRHGAGKSVMETSRELALEVFPDLLDSERVVIMVHALYREYGTEPEPPGMMELFAEMAEIAKEKGII